MLVGLVLNVSPGSLGDWKVLGMAEHELRELLYRLRDDFSSMSDNVSAIRSDIREVRDRGIRTEGRLEALEHEVSGPRGVRARLHDVEAAITWLKEGMSDLRSMARDWAARLDDAVSFKTSVSTEGHAEVVKWPMLKMILGACSLTLGGFIALLKLLGVL